ncbi:MAG: Gfo/Idh/MocA family oxidoreductase [Bacteroidia bacterium]|nr:Gfo/Idh/MocA family oxidoreductase [Bacteroidia bacterium]
MTPRIYNWAILGCGKIAGKFSSDLKLLPNARLYAAASRSLEKSQAFTNKYGFEKAYGTYEEMVADPKVDIVYVATPHSHHRDHAVLCLEHGKAVLVEKAFALAASQAKEMIDAAHRNKVFLMEAFWTRFQPAFKKAMEVLQSGDLGQARMMRSEFCFYSPYNHENRLYNLALGGGSLLDIGIYPVFWALQIFGIPSEIRTTVDLAPSGADRSIALTFKYPGGEIAQLASSFAVCSDTQTEIWCEKGFIRVRRIDPSTVMVILSRKDTSEEEYIFHLDKGFGLFLEAQHVMECLDANLKESPDLPLSFTFQQMQLLDKIRAQAGVFYKGGI